MFILSIVKNSNFFLPESKKKLIDFSSDVEEAFIWKDALNQKLLFHHFFFTWTPLFLNYKLSCAKSERIISSPLYSREIEWNLWDVIWFEKKKIWSISSMKLILHDHRKWSSLKKRRKGRKNSGENQEGCWQVAIDAAMF